MHRPFSLSISSIGLFNIQDLHNYTAFDEWANTTTSHWWWQNTYTEIQTKKKWSHNVRVFDSHGTLDLGAFGSWHSAQIRCIFDESFGADAHARIVLAQTVRYVCLALFVCQTIIADVMIQQMNAMYRVYKTNDDQKSAQHNCEIAIHFKTLILWFIIEWLKQSILIYVC